MAIVILIKKFCRLRKNTRVVEKGGRPLITPPHTGSKSSASPDAKRQLNAVFGAKCWEKY